MHTVITWRSRPTLHALNIRESHENPCGVLLGNAICYIISGLLLLVIGVVLLSSTFQNLEAYQKEYTEIFAGPILIVVGLLVLARGTFNQFRSVSQNNSRSVSIRRYAGETFTRPILDYSSNSVTLCSVSIGECHENPRHSVHNDEPPSYEVVMGSVVQQRMLPQLETLDEYTQSSEDFTEPPPTYEEFIRNVDTDTETSIDSPSPVSDCGNKAESESGPCLPHLSTLERMNTV